GYAESAGVLLATAVWWWAMMLAPLDRTWAAVRIALAWLVVFLAHRLGLVLLAPQLSRSLAPALEGDRTEARRLLLILTVVEAVAAAGFLAAVMPPGGALRDSRELLQGPAGPHGPRLTPALDVLSLLAVVAAPALLAPALAGAKLSRPSCGARRCPGSRSRRCRCRRRCSCTPLRPAGSARTATGT